MASLVFKHKSYYAVFSTNGKKKWVKIGRASKKEATKLLKQIELEYIKGKFSLDQIKPIHLYDFLNKYFTYCKTNKASSTYERELYITATIKSFFSDIQLHEIDNISIENYKSRRLLDNIQPVTINRELTVLRAMLTKARDWNYLNTLPLIKNLKVADRPVRFLSQVEIERLLKHSTPWLRPMILVLRNTGVRVVELLNLRLSDVDMDNRRLLVRSSKTNNYRVVPINSELATTLSWLARYCVKPPKLGPPFKLQIEHNFLCFYPPVF